MISGRYGCIIEICKFFFIFLQERILRLVQNRDFFLLNYIRLSLVLDGDVSGITIRDQGFINYIRHPFLEGFRGLSHSSVLAFVYSQRQVFLL